MNIISVSSFDIDLVKKWQIKLGDAGTMDHFDLAFQYQIKKMIKKDWTKTIANKNYKINV